MNRLRQQFFFAEPDRELAEFIIDCKKLAREIAGEQKYLNDFPHLTLYVGNFNYGERMFEELDSKLTMTTGEIKLEGWNTFLNDPVTSGHTIVIEVASTGLKFLRNIQMDVVRTANKYRSAKLLKRYENNESYTIEMKESLNKYGFPFVGDIWCPHFTIASFEKDVYEKVWEKLRLRRPPETVKIEKLKLSNIHFDHFELLKEWKTR